MTADQAQRSRARYSKHSTPATGKRLSTVASAGEADVERAVRSARRAFEKPSIEMFTELKSVWVELD